MKNLPLFFLLLVATAVSALDLTTTDGHTYRNVNITRVESDGIAITHSGGAAKIPFALLPDDLRRQYAPVRKPTTPPTTSPKPVQKDSVEILSISPASPAILKVGDKLKVVIRYRVTSTDTARVYVTPYSKGKPTPNTIRIVFAVRRGSDRESVCRPSCTETGVADEIRVEIVDVETRKILARVSQPFQVEWRGGDARRAGLALNTPDQSVLRSQLSNKPILRIETGMHTAPITSIATDAENRFLVTGSHDGTLRVWLLATGELLQVLRPPYAPNFESQIRSCAVSPNGNKIACGGQRGGGSDYGKGDFRIHIFDRLSGQMVSVIRGLTGATHQMTFSKDGRYLAAETTDALKVFRAARYKELASVSQILSGHKTVDFAPDGRLLTSGGDEFLCLYDQNYKLIARKRAPGGLHPVSAVFSPDGTKIAVGFRDSKKVNVLKALDLALLYETDTAGAVNSSFNNILFSVDGKRLIATGPCKGEDKEEVKAIPVRIWDEQGRGKYREIQLRPKGITRVLPLKNGELAFSARKPAWGVYDAAGERKVFVTSLGGLGKPGDVKLLVSQNGAGISVVHPKADDEPSFQFSVLDRQFGEESSGMLEPRTSAPTLGITDWKRGTPVVLNGKELQFMGTEFKNHLAISPDTKLLLVANQLGVCVFGRLGRTKWELPLPNAARAVNIAGNGQVAIVALGDRTIRWYRMSDGQELLALYTQASQGRWVLWTPSGYYDCSVGAEDLIGWHINNGEDAAADFYPVSRFRKTFYRPDVVGKILDTRNETEAVRLADAEANRQRTESVAIENILPPTIKILSPENGETVTSEEIEVRYSTHTPTNAPVTAVRLLVDGRPLEGTRGITVEAVAPKRSLKARLPGRDCEVALVAENRHGVSEPSRVRLKWGGKPAEEFVIKPKLYALVVGVSKYADANIQLKYAAKDARDFAAALERLKGGLYRDVVVRPLTDEKAVKDEVLDGLDWVRKETTQHDVAMVFLSGHGVNDADGSYYYLPANVNVEKLMQTGVEFTAIRRTVMSIVGKALFFVDTCHAGNVMGGRRGLNDITGIINELTSAENGAVVFASSTGRQYSLENDDWQNGAFTKALVEGLAGKADYGGKGRITINMLDLWLSERVKELTGGKQTPTTTKPQTIPDFPVAMPVR